MCRLLETIKIQDGILVNARYHSLRFRDSCRELFGHEDHRALEEIVVVPDQFRSGIHRCRIIYDRHTCSVEFSPWSLRTVHTLKMVNCDEIDYHLKFADRSLLEYLFTLRGDCDDIIIVKEGCLTDSFAANLVFFDGYRWFTPDTPLLKGTRRASLLESGGISEARITVRNYRNFQCAGLINAFTGPDLMQTINTDKIVPV